MSQRTRASRGGRTPRHHRTGRKMKTTWRIWLVRRSEDGLKLQINNQNKIRTKLYGGTI